MTIIAAITPPENKNLRRPKLGALFSSEPPAGNEGDFSGIRYSPRRNSYANPVTTPADCNHDAAEGTPTFYSNPNSAYTSPYNNLTSPWSQPSPYTKSPWTYQIVDSSISPAYALDAENAPGDVGGNGLIGSLFREEGHIYSLAAAGDLLYTGSESKNIRVWKNLKEFPGFKSSSGLVKAIVVFSDRVFTGHQDGKIRVWRCTGDKRKTHKRVGNLPTTRDLLMKSINPRNYVEVRRHRNVPWVKHYDAVSCLSADPVDGLLYSGSWDKTLKVWRISDSKCLESIGAHDDAVNAVAVGFDGMVFTGSADGTVKAWRRELVAGSVGHVLVETLLMQGHALTSLAVSQPSAEEGGGGALYAGSSDGLVSFWEREKHFMAYGGVLRGHRMAVLCLSAGGSLVVSGSADRIICVWRRGGGGAHTCLGVLTGHTGPVKCVAVERDGGRDGDDRRWIVYSGSLDKSVKVWRVSEGGGGMRELQGE